MTAANVGDCRALRRNIETCEIPHAAFVEHHRALTRRIDDALDGYSARMEALVGPTRVGKTMLINALKRRYPEEKNNGVRHVPVLVVPLPQNISPRLLPKSILEALGVPIPSRNSNAGDFDKRMFEQLKLAQTRVLLFEEASHLVEPGAKLPHRAAGDWFKVLGERLNITIVLFGVPRLRKLLASNEQIHGRACATREFRPYDWRDGAQMRAFAACVKSYADMFSSSGWPIGLSLETLTKHCYLLSGGCVGKLSHFMQELSTQLEPNSPRTLTIEDCFNASSAIEGRGHPEYPPFIREEVTAPEMSQVHSYILELNDMSVLQLPRAQRDAPLQGGH